MIHSFLLIGQSNAAGRGIASEIGPLKTNGGKLKVLRNGRWQTMYRPVNCDRYFSGVCLAESFALAYSNDHPEVEVGIIPAADGGTSLEQWKEGGLLFENAVNCAKLAMRTSNLVGILWHQGEADCAEELYPLYKEKFNAIKTALRNEIGLPDIPFVVGGLGDFLEYCTHSDNLKNYHYVNDALIASTLEDEHSAFAPATGLGANSDNLHFNAKSLYEFGIRYYDAFKQIMNVDLIKSEGTLESDSERREMEFL